MLARSKMRSVTNRLLKRGRAKKIHCPPLTQQRHFVVRNRWELLIDMADNALFLDALLLFAKESLREDAAWLHEVFEAHGTDDGLLWCALRKPALTGEILTHFSDTETFLTWVEEKSGETEQ